MMESQFVDRFKNCKSCKGYEAGGDALDDYKEVDD